MDCNLTAKSVSIVLALLIRFGIKLDCKIMCCTAPLSIILTYGINTERAAYDRNISSKKTSSNFSGILEMLIEGDVGSVVSLKTARSNLLI